MDGIAIIMMALFILIIWGGLAVSITHLMKHPDENAGKMGADPALSDEVLAGQEQQ